MFSDKYSLPTTLEGTLVGSVDTSDWCTLGSQKFAVLQPRYSSQNHSWLGCIFQLDTLKQKKYFVVFQAFISFRTSKTVFNLAYKQVILSEEDINIFGRSLDNWQRPFFKYSWKLCYSSRAYSLQTYNCRLTVCLPWLDTVVTIHTIA